MSAVMTAPRLRPEDDEFPEVGEQLEDSYAREVGRRITQARRELGLRQVDLARKMKVSQRSAQAWETGEVIPYRRMKALARVLKRDPNWLLHGSVEDETARLANIAEARLSNIERQLDDLGRLVRAMTKKLG